MEEGRLTVGLTATDGVVGEVAVRSTRETDFSQVLTGQTVDAALRLVPAVYSVCSTAHGVAGLTACEAALGITVGDRQRALRRVVCALEALDNHAFRFFINWPRVRGEAPKHEAFRDWRAATMAVRTSLAPQGVVHLGGVVAGRVEGVGVLQTLVGRWVPRDALSDVVALEKVGRVVWGEVVCRGSTRGPLVGSLREEWLLERLVSADFSARPTLDGVPGEAGAVAVVRSSAVDQVTARDGRTTWVRLLAGVAHVAQLMASLEADIREAAGAAPGPTRTQDSGRGVGLTETSRGALAHAVTLDQWRVVSWRTVAPTEWSFHPRGAVREAFLGMHLKEVPAQAPIVIAGLDPCVGCQVVVDAAS